MLLRLGDKMMIADRMPGGPPGPAYGRSGWGMPSWAYRPTGGVMKPMPVGARYFCGDDYPMYEAQEHPCAQGNQFNSTKQVYQEAVTAHYTEEHPDLHYPIDQTGIDGMQRAKRKAQALLRQQADLKELAKWNEEGVGGGGGFDPSGSYRPVTRPRELPDFTEFDFPDANVADAGTEEIELDQLISIQARQGRRLLGVELQGIDAEMVTELQTAATGADLEMATSIELNTRTGAHNLDDPENLWRAAYSIVVTSPVATETNVLAIQSENDVPPGGVVYVAPRLFWRFVNQLDRQVDIGDLFTRIATINQPLSTFLLFELLEQFSGLFGLT